MVSIIIPVYNTEKYLNKCLSSVLSQTYKDIELIAINDGSTDYSLAILEEYSAKDDRIRVYSTENKGQGAARNLGISMANGEYIMFCDSDDWLDEKCVEILLKSIENNMADIAIGRIMKTKFECEDEASPLTECETDIISDENKDDLLFSISTYPVAKLFRTKLIIDNNIQFPTHFFEDVAILPVISALAGRICFVKNTVYFYRNRAGSTVNLINHINDRILCIETLVNEFKKRGLYQRFEKQLRGYALIRRQVNLRVVKTLTNRITTQFIEHQNSFFSEHFGEQDYKIPNVFVFGSYNLMIASKIFMRLEDAATVENYYGGESIISCMSKTKGALRILPVRHQIQFRRKQLLFDFEKRLSQLSKGWFDDVDYFIVDLLEERYDVGCYKGEYFTISSAFSDVSETLGIEYSVLERFSNEWFEAWKESCDRFIKMLKSYVSEDRIIVVKTKLAESYSSSAGIIPFENAKELHETNKQLDKCYKYFLDNCNQARVVDITEIPNYYTDKAFRHGCYPWHLSNEVYSNMAKLIENTAK